MKKFLLLTAIASVASLAAVAPAMAQSATSTITVGATTAAKCTAPAAVTVPLGNYDGLAAITSTADIRFKCTNSTPATVVLTSASTTSNTSGNLLDPATSTPILYGFTGNATGATGAGLGSGVADISVVSTITVAANQNPIPGTGYSDTINVSVNY